MWVPVPKANQVLAVVYELDCCWQATLFLKINQELALQLWILNYLAIFFIKKNNVKFKQSPKT